MIKANPKAVYNIIYNAWINVGAIPKYAKLQALDASDVIRYEPHAKRVAQAIENRYGTFA